ncbi:helix-turn-helix domain-containing protein [Streptomyces adustus]|uniref:Helix-turn-helix domain-containing protein n=1 Tax=Streptomyces adustus TaxID=1609272 RepID=A0A5N8VQB1_9ACTN|nr:helix-turn-helix domain-containing protein [Streptomyces adustus]MPY36942.1 helix-turn-helix domain-containing protein [Streptomyces adustus]
MSVVFSVRSKPGSARLEHWQEEVFRTFVPLRITLPEDEPFSGTISTDLLGPLQATTVDCDRGRVDRTPRLIARDTSGFVYVGLQRSGRAHVDQDGRSAQLRPDDVALYDTTRPYTLRFPQRFRMQVLLVPRPLLPQPEADLQRVTATVLCHDDGLGRVVLPFLRNLVDNAPDLPAAAGETLAAHAVDLVGAFLAERLGRDAQDTPGGGLALLLRIKAFIDRHLADPGLSLAVIAREHRISVRYLHKLFENESTTASRWIQRRRLDACRGELSRRSPLTPTVAAVARRWGFTDAAHFSRAFRAAYGVSPSEWRAGSEG